MGMIRKANYSGSIISNNKRIAEYRVRTDEFVYLLIYFMYYEYR